jgi:hypothetical protein
VWGVVFGKRKTVKMRLPSISFLFGIDTFISFYYSSLLRYFRLSFEKWRMVDAVIPKSQPQNSTNFWSSWSESPWSEKRNSPYVKTSPFRIFRITEKW